MTSPTPVDLEIEWEPLDDEKKKLLNRIPTDLLEEGEVLYRQGNHSGEFSVVKLGRLEVAKHAKSGEKTILGMFGPGQPVGAMAVLKEIPYPATVRATKDTIVYRFDAELLPEIKGIVPGWFSETLGKTADRFADIADRFESSATRSLEGRLARQLWRLAEEHGKEVDGDLLIDTRVTRQMLADMVGCRVESAIRRISRWEKEGLLETRDSRITLLDPYRIRSMAESDD